MDKDGNGNFNELNNADFDFEKYNDVESDKNGKLGRAESLEGISKKMKKKRKKKKWNKLISQGSVSSFEGSSIVRRDTEQLRKLKHHFVNDVDYDHDEVTPYYEKGGAYDKIEYDRPLGDEKRKKKKKKKIIDLKKTSSKVGIVNHDDFPPIQPDTFGASVREHAHEQHEPSVSSENKGDTLSGSTVSLISSTKEPTSTTFPKPLRFCVWITHYPLISFCKSPLYISLQVPIFFTII